LASCEEAAAFLISPFATPLPENLQRSPGDEFSECTFGLFNRCLRVRPRASEAD